MRHRRCSGFALEGWRNPAATTILMDRSRFKNNGAFTGATWVQLPTGAWVMDFTNAANLVTIPAAASINDMPEFTFECWVKIVGAGGTFSVVLNKRSGSTNGFLIFLLTDGSKCYGIQQHFTTNDIVAKTGINSIEYGVWKHLSIAYNKTNTSNQPVFRENGLVMASTMTGTPSGVFNSDVASNMTLGNRVGSDRYMNGYMSAPKIYNYLRTEAQALAAFTAERYLYGV